MYQMPEKWENMCPFRKEDVAMQLEKTVQKKSQTDLLMEGTLHSDGATKQLIFANTKSKSLTHL